MALMINTGDIIIFNHFDANSNVTRHPFLVIKIDQISLIALQVTSVKYSKGNIVLDRFQQQIVKDNNYVEVDSNDGFKYHSIVICDKYYEVKWGENIYEVFKVGEITNRTKFLQILEKHYGYPPSLFPFKL